MTRTAIVMKAATGEALALFDNPYDVLKWERTAKDYFAEAAGCGHSAAPGWADSHFPLSFTIISDVERDQILEEGVPTLQREP